MQQSDDTWLDPNMVFFLEQSSWTVLNALMQYFVLRSNGSKYYFKYTFKAVHFLAILDPGAHRAITIASILTKWSRTVDSEIQHLATSFLWLLVISSEANILCQRIEENGWLNLLFILANPFIVVCFRMEEVLSGPFQAIHSTQILRSYAESITRFVLYSKPLVAMLRPTRLALLCRCCFSDEGLRTQLRLYLSLPVSFSSWSQVHFPICGLVYLLVWTQGLRQTQNGQPMTSVGWYYVPTATPQTAGVSKLAHLSCIQWSGSKCHGRLAY